jgi:hypothetical protein
MLSEVDYPGWRVSGAEKRSPFLGVFRTFETTEPDAHVTLIFRPVSLYSGVALSVAGIMILAFRKKQPVGNDKEAQGRSAFRPPDEQTPGRVR